MASLPAENWSSCIDMDTNDQYFPGAADHGVSSSNMSNALLMSLLEETQGDQEHDEERLSSLIRALEIELDPSKSDENEIFMDNLHQFCSISQEDIQPFDVGYVSGGECSVTDAPGFSWINDMEMKSCDDQSVDWYLDSCLDEIECTSGFGGSHAVTTTFFEEHGYQNLWQDKSINARMQYS